MKFNHSFHFFVIEVSDWLAYRMIKTGNELEQLHKVDKENVSRNAGIVVFFLISSAQSAQLSNGILLDERI